MHRTARFTFIVALALLGAVVPSAAHADPVVITCTGSTTQSYDPGLTLTARATDVSATGALSCLGGGSVNSASYSFNYNVSTSCLAGSPITSGSNTFDWNSGPSSVTAETFVVTRPVGQTVVTGVGTVTSGQFAGFTVVHVITYPALNLLDCLGSGVTSQTGVESLTLASV